MIFRSEFHFYNFIPAIICIAGVVIQNISKHTQRRKIWNGRFSACHYRILFVICALLKGE